MPGTIVLWILAIAILLFVIVTLAKAITIVRQSDALIIERLGKYNRTLYGGPHGIIPFFEKPRLRVDLREQVVSFPPQGVITEDNLTVDVDTVVYFTVTDPRAATYEIANYLGAVEQLTITTLRNVVGSLNLEQALVSRDTINAKLMTELDEATGRWGIKVNRVELKAIDPPPSLQDAMEKQMRAERDRRAAILTAEGHKQSQILVAEGARQSEILKADGDKQSQVLRAQGESEAIQTVFHAIHAGAPDDKLLAYQYLQTLPKIAEGESSKMWIIPSEMTEALKGIAGGFAGGGQAGPSGSAPTPPAPVPPKPSSSAAEAAAAAVAEAAKVTEEAEAEATTSSVGGAPAPATRAEQRAAPAEGTIPPAPPAPGGYPPNE
ncbi:SPFH domain-containing protein [Microbacterium halotolerans]|uniref:SPFH domain-containing protein n=1 Tax=Microbacterium halotolerans TaxID=246613 RepID=UPI000E6AD752|nr:SPFH domain-containing protein [Microbacterium halotolerans]